ncbi:PIN domain nuclease [Mobilicoccus caccae]|uniref:Ribonuclease VapC n=1 Tax=Mobilicoccus caccae TaxID=1859295 RepID=A0ABQ6IJL9_9MICO|nr:PIN domain nuclease [Mobilicoccus caccae]GMA38094.1 ribonuclease VapC [Mobilicoccus caccae]
MSDGRWLLAKSALWRIATAGDAAEWFERIRRGLVHICTPTLLEIGFSARNSTDWASLVTEPPVSLMPVTYTTPAAELRALEVQRLLAGKGRHRAPGIPDLLVAATAEAESLTVLHLDKDFDLIAEVTGQSVERLRLG